MTDLYEYVGRKIRALRGEYAGGKGLKQEELAEAVGVTANTLSRWESAVYRPSLKDLQKLAKVFGVSISIFFPDEQDEGVQALLSATGDLRKDELDDLIEYAKFRKARRALKKAKKRGK
jgi:transcriptional regulator with XRE-family HTH domain